MGLFVGGIGVYSDGCLYYFSCEIQYGEPGAYAVGVAEVAESGEQDYFIGEGVEELS